MESIMKFILAFLIISNTYAGEVINVDLTKEKQVLELCRLDQNILKFSEEIKGVVSSKTLQKENDLDINYPGKFIVINNQKLDGSLVVSAEKIISPTQTEKFVSLIQLKYKDCKVDKLKKISIE
jgi:hypothetical protein